MKNMDKFVKTVLNNFIVVLFLELYRTFSFFYCLILIEKFEVDVRKLDDYVWIGIVYIEIVRYLLVLLYSVIIVKFYFFK